MEKIIKHLDWSRDSRFQKAEFPVGTERTWTDGSKHIKQSDGSWKEVAGNDNTKLKQAIAKYGRDDENLLEKIKDLKSAGMVDVMPKGGNWFTGTINGIHFEIQMFSEGSSNGINGTRISKIYYRLPGTQKIKSYYDRGFDGDAPADVTTINAIKKLVSGISHKNDSVGVDVPEENRLDVSSKKKWDSFSNVTLDRKDKVLISDVNKNKDWMDFDLVTELKADKEMWDGKKLTPMGEKTFIGMLRDNDEGGYGSLRDEIR